MPLHACVTEHRHAPACVWDGAPSCSCMCVFSFTCFTTDFTIGSVRIVRFQPGIDLPEVVAVSAYRFYVLNTVLRHASNRFVTSRPLVILAVFNLTILSRFALGAILLEVMFINRHVCIRQLKSSVRKFDHPRGPLIIGTNYKKLVNPYGPPCIRDLSI